MGIMKMIYASRAAGRNHLMTDNNTVIPEGPAPQTPQTRQERLDYGRTVFDAVNGGIGQRVLDTLEDV